jgi:RHS repeat-associated protein
MQMPGRTFSSGSYRYGFNGKENDKEISASGQDYGMRIYDGRIGRFLSVDPLSPKYPWYTPYQFAGNKPIVFIDLDGLEECSADAAMMRDDKAYLSGNMTAEKRRENQIARGTGGLIGAAIVVDAFVAKGAVTRWLFTSVVLGHLYHNGTNNPVEQKKRSDDLKSDAIALGTGFIFGKILGSTISILRGPVKEEVNYLFRGTTAGFEGSKASQTIPITPTSSDPGVATIFSIAASKNGKGILQIALPSDLGNVSYGANVLQTLEKEIGVRLKPADFAAKASITITTDQARSILKGLGVDLPAKISISELSNVIKRTPKLSQSQVSQFYKKAAEIKNP